MQDIIVYVIGAFAVLYIVLSVRRLILRVKRNESPCGSCTGCDLKEKCADKKCDCDKK